MDKTDIVPMGLQHHSIVASTSAFSLCKPYNEVPKVSSLRQERIV